MMATYTTNLNLKKPAVGEKANIADINGNMDILDSAVAGKAAKNGRTSTSGWDAVTNADFFRIALNYISNNIASRDSGVHMIPTSSGPIMCTLLMKYSDSYFCGLMMTYTSPQNQFITFQYSNGTYSVSYFG